MYGVYCMDYQYPVVQVSRRIPATFIESWCLLCMFFGQNRSLCAGFVEEHCFHAGLLGLVHPRPWQLGGSAEGIEAPACEQYCLIL